MRTLLARSLFVVGFSFIPLAIYGQGVYTSAAIDGGPDPAFLDTFVEAYPTPPGICGGSYNVWNNFNDNFVSGFAPVTLESGSWASSGVEYSWSYGFTVLYENPYGGGCISQGMVFTVSLSFAITYTSAAHIYVDPDGYCDQNNACTNTSTPRCPVTRTNEGENAVGCDIYHVTLVPIWDGVCKTGTSAPWGGPGPCTI